MFRRVTQIVAVGAVGLSIWSVLAIMTFRFPRVDPPQETDAYYFLASPGGMAALQSHRDTTLPPDKPLLLSVTPLMRLFPEYQRACAGGLEREVICVEPDPSTTQGEAQQLGRVAAERQWQSVTVVTHHSHITRSRILMKRCFPGEVRMTAVGAENGKRMWLRALLYESGAMVKTMVLRGC